MVTSWLRRDTREERKDGEAVEQRNILVAVAGNDMDEDLARMACSLCAKKGVRGRVIAIHVVEIPRTLPLDTMVDDNASEGILDRAAAVAQSMNVEIEAEVVQAREAGPAIVDEAND